MPVFANGFHPAAPVRAVGSEPLPAELNQEEDIDTQDVDAIDDDTQPVPVTN